MATRFVSYAQNFEDVMLWRALKNQPPGIYVDVGANDPVIDSVTKAFYDRGWRGINIDAVAGFVERLKNERPEDANYALFVGAGESIMDFYQVGDTGISTYKKDYAVRHLRAGHEVSKIQVEMKTLTSILQDCEVPNDRFHFLKIDVEGAEADVLLGLDLEKYRPWIVVVEATEPNSTNLNLAYEPLLLGNGYRFVYFDGLNRFYVAEERSGLIQAFQSPPCVFDEFDLWETVCAREAALAAEARRAAALEDVRKLITSKDQLIEVKDAQICSSHAAMIQFEHRASLLHSKFIKESGRAGKGLSGAYKTLYSSALWKRGAWIARLFRAKSPRGPLNKAAKVIRDSNSLHGEALKKLRDDMSRVTEASATPPARSRLGKSAAAVADLINAGCSANPFKQ